MSNRRGPQFGQVFRTSIGIPFWNEWSTSNSTSRYQPDNNTTRQTLQQGSINQTDLPIQDVQKPGY
jgi:hypothetical protein